GLDLFEEPREMNLASARLMPPRDVADLYVSHMRISTTQRLGQISLLHLNVVGVKTQLDVRLAECVDTGQAFVNAAVEVIRKACRATGLQNQRQSCVTHHIGRMGDVL